MIFKCHFQVFFSRKIYQPGEELLTAVNKFDKLCNILIYKVIVCVIELYRLVFNSISTGFQQKKV